MKRKWYLIIVCLVSCVTVWAQDNQPLWSIDNLKLSLKDSNGENGVIVKDNNSFNIPDNWNGGTVEFQFDIKKTRAAAENEDSIAPTEIWYQINGANAKSTDITLEFKSAVGKDSTWSVSTSINVTVGQMNKDKDNAFGLGLSENGTYKIVTEVVHVWSLPEDPTLTPNNNETFVGKDIELTVMDNVSSGLTSEYSINGVKVNDKNYSVKAEEVGTELSKVVNYTLSFKYGYGTKIWKEGTLPAIAITIYHLPVYAPIVIVNDEKNDTYKSQGSSIEHTVMPTDKVSFKYEVDYGYKTGTQLSNQWNPKDSSFVANNSQTSTVKIRNYINKSIYDEQTLTYMINVRPQPDVTFHHIKADETSYLFAPSADTKVSVDLKNNQDDLNWSYEWYFEGNDNNFSTIKETLIPKELLPIGVKTLKVSVVCKRGNFDKKYVNKTLTHTINVVSLPKASVKNKEDNSNTNIITCDGQTADVIITSEGGYAEGYHFFIESKEGGDYGTSSKSEGDDYTIKYKNQSGNTVSSVFNFAGTNTIPESKSTIEGGQVQNVSFEGNSTFKATIYPHPKVQFKKQLLDNYYYGTTINQSLDTVYNFLPSSWTFEWSLNDENLSSDKKDDYIIYVSDGGELTDTKNTLSIKAVNKYEGKIWEETTLTHDFTAWHRANLVGIGLSHENSNNTNIYEGHTFNLSALTQYGYPEGWKYTWKRDDNDDVLSTKGTDEFVAKFYGNEGSENQTYKLHVVNSIPGLDEGSELLFQKDANLSLTIWRKAENYVAGSDASIITITDKENGATITDRIREGSELLLQVPQAQYGYNNDWTYTWNGTYTKNPQTTLPIDKVQASDEAMKKESRTLSLTITNMGPNELPWESATMSKTYTVYRKPKTPTSLAQKGNGVSRTLIATTAISDQQLQDNDYYLCFGHRETNGAVTLISEPILQEGPGQTRFSTQVPQDIWNDKNNLCVFALWHYSDGPWITSGLRFISDVKEDWDGSDYTGKSSYSGTTRGGDTTGIQETAISSQDIQATYGINGTVRGTMRRGLNIVRMADGTVRKVIKK